MKILVIGAGSIGRRHIGNLNSLGYEDIDVADLSEECIKYVRANYKVGDCFRESEKAISSKHYDAAFILTPPAHHIGIACKLAEKGTDLFIEKPLSDSLDGIDLLVKTKEEKKIVAMVGYNQRFNQGIRKLKEYIESGSLGKIYYIRAEVGQYLPDWRPWQDYRRSYTARKELGGGIILDASHEIDYVLWLAKSKVTAVKSLYGRLSDLEIDVEDLAETIMGFENKVIGSVHLNMLERGYNRYCRIVGEKGSVKWTFKEGLMEYYDGAADKKWSEILVLDPNQSYLDELRHFFSCVEKREEPVTNLYTAKETLVTVMRIKGGKECQPQ